MAGKMKSTDPLMALTKPKPSPGKKNTGKGAAKSSKPAQGSVRQPINTPTTGRGY